MQGSRIGSVLAAFEETLSRNRACGGDRSKSFITGIAGTPLSPFKSPRTWTRSKSERLSKDSSARKDAVNSISRLPFEGGASDTMHCQESAAKRPRQEYLRSVSCKAAASDFFQGAIESFGSTGTDDCLDNSSSHIETPARSLYNSSTEKPVERTGDRRSRWGKCHSDRHLLNRRKDFLCLSPMADSCSTTSFETCSSVGSHAQASIDAFTKRSLLRTPRQPRSVPNSPRMSLSPRKISHERRASVFGGLDQIKPAPILDESGSEFTASPMKCSPMRTTKREVPQRSQTAHRPGRISAFELNLKKTQIQARAFSRKKGQQYSVPVIDKKKEGDQKASLVTPTKELINQRRKAFEPNMSRPKVQVIIPRSRLESVGSAGNSLKSRQPRLTSSHSFSERQSKQHESAKCSLPCAPLTDDMTRNLNEAAEASTKIQRSIRTFLTRKKYLKFHSQIVKFQASFRGYMIRMHRRARVLEDMLLSLDTRRKNDLVLVQLQKWRQMDSLRKAAEQEEKENAEIMADADKYIEYLKNDNSKIQDQNAKLEEVTVHLRKMNAQTELAVKLLTDNFYTMSLAVEALMEKNEKLTKNALKYEEKVDEHQAELEITRAQINFEVAVRKTSEKFIGALVELVETRCSDQHLIDRVLALSAGEADEEPSACPPVEDETAGFELSLRMNATDDVSVLDDLTYKGSIINDDSSYEEVEVTEHDEDSCFNQSCMTADSSVYEEKNSISWN